MADMPTLRNIVNDTPTDATDVEWNFNTIETFVDTGLVNIDGTNAMTAPLTLQAGDPTNTTDATNKQYVDKTVPAGAMMEYAGDTLTAEMDAAQGGQWLICNGAIITDATYPDLATILDSKFDTETPPAGQSYLPDFRRRVAVGYDALTAPFDTFGEQGGVAASELITHTHIQNQHDHGLTGGVSNGKADHTHTFSDSSSTTSLNGGHDHDIGNGEGIVYLKINQSAGLGGGSDPRVAWAVWDGNVNSADAGRHSHTVAVSGTTGGPSNTDATHGHGDNFAVSNKTPTNQEEGTATAADDGNYPPYVIVTKIIHI
jgi:microcystin-dependent protein